MNGEFIQGRIKLNPQECEALANEYAGLIWREWTETRIYQPYRLIVIPAIY